MAKKPINNSCPYCGGTQGVYQTVINREVFSLGFDGSKYGVETFYLRGGSIKRCVDCDKPIDVSEIEVKH
jgi:hypothetical protein